MRFAPFILLLLATPTFAQQRVLYKVSSGTGFVVNNEGHVVTNAHVVRGCQSISILSPKGEEQADLVAANTAQDLAVLKTHYMSPYTAPLRWNIADLKVGDGVIIMGYPGQQGLNGHYEYKKTSITSLKGPTGEEKFIQLASVAAHGNSGGPVLDGSGNVIAVISGTALTYHADSNGKATGNAIGQSDVAITLASLQDFLRSNRINFYESASGMVAYGDGVLRDNAHNFIVPVRCIQGVVMQ
jgi:S1-C subfamily serine protease